MTKMEEYQAFVACLTYGEEMVPMTVEDAQYTLDMWKEEGSIEAPEGFTAEIYAEIWNSYCPPEPDPEPEEDAAKKQYMLKTRSDGILQISIKTGAEIAEIYDLDQRCGIYDSIEVWDVENEPKQIKLLGLVEPILEHQRWIEREYRDYCENER